MSNLITNTIVLTAVGQALCLLAFGAFQPTAPIPGPACDDGNAATEDIQLIGGSCGHVPTCIAVSDCTGGQTGSWVSCYQQKCYWYCNPAVCPTGDIDSDGKVGAYDLAILLQEWGPLDDFYPADIDGDFKVDATDLAELLNSWENENG